VPISCITDRIYRCAAVTIGGVLALDDDAWLLLHEVRLRGIVDGSNGPHVARLEQIGFVARAARGLRVTTEGRDAHTEWARLPAGSNEAEVVTRAYQKFLPLNRELLRVCSDWQVRPGGAPNDHRDARYDWAIVDRLRGLDERTGPIVRHVARAVRRFGTYRPRLSQALSYIDDGAHEWLTSPRCDSYHTVWMQMHEDFLLALGLDRSTEEAGK
jgi:hypothetical protein